MKAIKYFLKAEKILNGIAQIHLLEEVYRNLALVYEKIGDNEKGEDYKRKLSSAINLIGDEGGDVGAKRNKKKHKI